MASEALFQTLASALSRPSRAYRSAIAGIDAVKAPIEGYEEGLAARQNINSAKFLNTPLSNVFTDNSRIPYNLKPNNTVGQLITVSKSLSGYIPPEVTAYNAAMTRLINKQMGATDSGGSGGGNPPAGGTTPTTTPSVPTPNSGPSTTPAPRPSSATTPEDPNAELNAISGAGADAGGNVSGGAPAQPDGLPEIPAGGMSSKAYAMMQAAQKTGIQAGQFAENQRRERSQFATSEAEHERMHNQDLAAARGRATATAISTHIAPTLQQVGNAQSLAATLEPYVKNDTFIPVVGGQGPAVAQKLGPYGPDVAMNKLRIKNIGNALGITMNKIFVNRYNDAERTALQDSLIPGPNDPLKDEKMTRLNSVLAALKSGKLQEAEAITDSLAGRSPNLTAMGTPGGAVTPPPTTPGQLSPAAKAFLDKYGGAQKPVTVNGNP